MMSTPSLEATSPLSKLYSYINRKISKVFSIVPASSDNVADTKQITKGDGKGDGGRGEACTRQISKLMHKPASYFVYYDCQAVSWPGRDITVPCRVEPELGAPRHTVTVTHWLSQNVAVRLPSDRLSRAGDNNARGNDDHDSEACTILCKQG